MPRPENDGPDDGWGRRGQERRELLDAIASGSPTGRAFTAQLETLSPARAAAETRWLFAFTPTTRLAGAIAHDLRLDSARAEAIAREIETARQRTARATRPLRKRTG